VLLLIGLQLLQIAQLFHSQQDRSNVNILET
jgi:hypothetical protein